MQIVRSNELEFVPASHEDRTAPGVIKKVLFSKEGMESGQPQMINWARLKVGKAFRAHYHQDMYEIFILMTGAVKIRIDAEEANLTAGDAVFVPARAVHEMWNLGEVDADYLAIGIAGTADGRTVIASS